MANRTRKSDAGRMNSSRLVTAGIAVLGVSALVLATGLLFIAPQLSLMIYGLGGIALFIGNHVAEQRKWESRAEARMTRLQKQHTKMAEEIELNHYRLELLKSEVAKISVPDMGGVRPSSMAAAAVASGVVSKSSSGSVPAPSPAAQGALLQESLRAARKVASTSPKSAARPVARALDKPTAVAPTARKKAASPVRMVANDRKMPRTGSGKSFHDTLSDIVVKELLHHAVKENDLAMFVQPIVRLPEGEVKFYEVFGRLRAREGAYIPAARYMDFARHGDMVGQIDNQVLMHCLKGLSTAQGRMGPLVFFLNVEPRSIKDPVFMDSLLNFLAQNRNLARSLVLEIPQVFFERRDIKTTKILQGLKALGCAFSLDHVRSLKIDLEDLHRTQVRFVKISASMVLKSMQDVRTRNDMVRMKRLLESNGIGVIVEKIESQETLEILKRFGLHYGQGYLFGRPDHSQTYGIEKAA